MRKDQRKGGKRKRKGKEKTREITLIKRKEREK